MLTIPTRITVLLISIDSATSGAGHIYGLIRRGSSCLLNYCSFPRRMSGKRLFEPLTWNCFVCSSFACTVLAPGESAADTSRQFSVLDESHNCQRCSTFLRHGFCIVGPFSSEVFFGKKAFFWDRKKNRWGRSISNPRISGISRLRHSQQNTVRKFECLGFYRRDLSFLLPPCQSKCRISALLLLSIQKAVCHQIQRYHNALRTYFPSVWSFHSEHKRQHHAATEWHFAFYRRVCSKARWQDIFNLWRRCIRSFGDPSSWIQLRRDSSPNSRACSKANFLVPCFFARF